MLKRIIITSVLAIAVLQAPAAASAADFSGTAKPDLTMCKLFAWLPSCKNMIM